MATQNKQQGRWYVRRGDRVQGPFPNQLISRYLILGRMDLDTEVSSDQIHWAPVRQFKALVPEVVLNANTPEGRKALMLARVREDERRAREAESTDNPDQPERRMDEDQIMQLHRQLRDDLLGRYRSQPTITRRNLAVLLSLLAVLVLGLLFYRPTQVADGVDCAAPPAPGVNWSGCNKQGASLAGQDMSGAMLKSSGLSGADFTRSRLDGSDLSYADLDQSQLAQASLRNSSLVGANLRKANLQGAQLSGANLAYAELEGARLDGAVLDNARFDNAIWVNGQQCLPGSRGACLLPK